jgi:hypothetical protein
MSWVAANLRLARQGAKLLRAEQLVAEMRRYRSLAVEAYQEKLFQPDLSRVEAAKRIDLLKREIELADSF